MIFFALLFFFACFWRDEGGKSVATPQYSFILYSSFLCLLYGKRWRHRNSLYILLFFPSVMIWNCINPVQTKLLLHRTSMDAVRFVPDGGESTVENTTRSTRRL